MIRGRWVFVVDVTRGSVSATQSSRVSHIPSDDDRPGEVSRSGENDSPVDVVRSGENDSPVEVVRSGENDSPEEVAQLGENDLCQQTGVAIFPNPLVFVTLTAPSNIRRKNPAAYYRTI